MSALDTITIKGFRSIKELEGFELNPGVNLFIGANGAGKSNLIAFFRLYRHFIEGYLAEYFIDYGVVSSHLYNGRKATSKMSFETHFGERGHRYEIQVTAEGQPAVMNEARCYDKPSRRWWELAGGGGVTSRVASEALAQSGQSEYSQPVYDAVTSWQLYHFHDTSHTANMKQYEIVEDDAYLRADGGNIAPFLLRLKTSHEGDYRKIVNAIRLVLPFFDDFLLKPRSNGGGEEVNLSWKDQSSDYPFQPYHLSDGSLRFIGLATALLQPAPPSTIIIDEPELGLHPHALEILGELIQTAGAKTQLIIATQSESLLNHFSVAEIVTVNREDGQSVFKRLQEEEYQAWLEEYSLGQLWTKNIIEGGGPSYE